MVALSTLHAACREIFTAGERHGPTLIVKTRPDLWIGPRAYLASNGADSGRQIASALTSISRYIAKGERRVILGCTSKPLNASKRTTPVVHSLGDMLYVTTSEVLDLFDGYDHLACGEELRRAGWPGELIDTCRSIWMLQHNVTLVYHPFDFYIVRAGPTGRVQSWKRVVCASLPPVTTKLSQGLSFTRAAFDLFTSPPAADIENTTAPPAPPRLPAANVVPSPPPPPPPLSPTIARKTSPSAERATAFYTSKHNCAIRVTDAFSKLVRQACIRLAVSSQTNKTVQET